MSAASEGLRFQVARALSTVFWIGYFPVAPGTAASAVALLPYLFFPIFQQPAVLAAGVLFATVIGVWSGGIMEDAAGEDPSEVTVDEVAGQWLALLALPSGLLPVLLAFIFFRLFDILKPGPVDLVQRLPGGWGIMMDDLLAGLFANLAVRILLFSAAFFQLSLPV
ncbi:phosphatidylglycerophosphatase A family protein [Chlorobium phaeovibrioides]|uniref:Phosphatidylglycerophosphatase A n=1 Tax=Chlorobium phaeovibrioides TaxID=1094 RepID=A0A3S0NZP1_CHLPH|nr:phosphatidylglycerophosphatase A [Chlorobium phaeovibrioides]KAA6232151.1 phosphatidylglycerophosphatase A [Chlorobium phaeovibrioides]MWV54726.1 phosphatidylglycerophosphatase A [Chlorobium phaeovibrioides]QEQ57325.1 phosphatidylglycerophosphatase A [Chlorobium phaeovibrioides]RTY38463.1 phosphatidylglycerophosphatase A [Chlorobium phaeovibrioides]